MRVRMTSVVSALLLIMLAGQPATARAEAFEGPVVLQWNAVALEAVRRAAPVPPAVARALAIVHTCMYDAWAASDAVAAGVHYHGKNLSAGSDQQRRRAVSYAAHRALLDLFPGQRALFEDLMRDLGYAPDDTADPASALGADAATAVIEARQFDGANQAANYADTSDYVPYNSADMLLDPSRWQPLTSASGVVQQFAVPHWGSVEPFALVSPDQFRPPPPATYPHGRYRSEALAVLHQSARLGDREKVIASYWADGPHSETPPGHWALFAQFVSRRDRHTLEEDIKLFFVLSNGLLDASIACWDTKRHYDFARPVTAIRFLLAGRPVRAWAGPYQGTELIFGDQWQSYLPTPPFAEYVSGHSTFSAASAEILARMTGSDTFGAEATIEAGSSGIEPGLVPRAAIRLRWATFSDAAEEAGVSRRYGGIHFKDGDLTGRAMGRLIGRQAWTKALSYFSGTSDAGEHSAAAVRAVAH